MLTLKYDWFFKSSIKIIIKSIKFIERSHKIIKNFPLKKTPLKLLKTPVKMRYLYVNSSNNNIEYKK